MRTYDEPVVRTALPDIATVFGGLLAGTLDAERETALDDSLRRLRRGDHTSDFQSAAPEAPGSETG
jgi:hypothetical protein